MSSWVRLWLDMPTDPKWRVIARKSGQPLPCVIALFTLMLTEGGKAAAPGTVAGLSIEDAAAALDMDEDAVSSIIEAMDGRVISEGRLTGWEKRQPKREDDSSKRVKEHRERKKQEVKRDVTHGNAPEAEAEAEAEAAKAAAGAGENSELEGKGVDLADLTSKISTIIGVPISDWGDAARSQKVVQGWLDAGADPAFLIETLTSRKSTTRSKPKSLQWFDGAVRDAISSRKTEASTVAADTGALIDRILRKDAA